jgi:hypothetical protein
MRQQFEYITGVSATGKCFCDLVHFLAAEGALLITFPRWLSPVSEVLRRSYSFLLWFDHPTNSHFTVSKNYGITLAISLKFWEVENQCAC